MSFIFKNYGHKLLLGPGSTGTVQQYQLRSKNAEMKVKFQHKTFKKHVKNAFFSNLTMQAYY